MAWAVLDNEKDLLLRISEGDERAFEIVYRATNASLFNAVIQYIRDEDSAMDILQEIYTRIWATRHQLTEVRSLKNYLFIMARNAAFNFLKRGNFEQKYKLTLIRQGREQTQLPFAELEEKEIRRLYQEALRKLPARQKEVYQLAEQEGLSHADIANRLKISYHTVKRHLEVARQTIRAYMNHQIHPCVALPLGLLAYGHLSFL